MPSVFSHLSFDAHEQVLFVCDKTSAMTGIIAIHSTALGPAAGGCRMYPYATIDEALNDVLRLSRGMTMKNATAGLPLGGGKCVIIADPTAPGKEARIRAMARHVQRLAGSYWTAIDVGISAEDADLMAEECDYVFARASDFSRDFPPAHFTALGGFQGVRAAAQFLNGSDDIQGLRVAVQGLGATGADLTGLLVTSGADVIAADIDDSRLTEVVRKYGIRTVSPDVIHAQEVDIFAPCALGGVINDRTIPELNCRAIVGLANNQLESAEHGERLMEEKIAYAPDFVVNAGGMMGASMPIFSTPDKARSLQHVDGIYATVLNILKRSEREGVASEAIAEDISMQLIAEAGKLT